MCTNVNAIAMLVVSFTEDYEIPPPPGGEWDSSYLSGVKIFKLVPLRVLKSKITTVKIAAVPVRELRYDG